jgi:SAM-dependent methyltransferase
MMPGTHELRAQNQETEGLLSPWLRSQRLRRAASFVVAGSVVLDIASGAGFLKAFLPPRCRYFGVDRIQPRDTTRFEQFLAADILAPASLPTVQNWLGLRADVITMLAFVEHIKNPELILAPLKTLLAPNGKIILTTPHPLGRRLHDGLSRIGICSPSAAAEHEQFLDRQTLENVTSAAGYTTVRYERFLFGLNQIQVIAPRKQSTPI